MTPSAERLWRVPDESPDEARISRRTAGSDARRVRAVSRQWVGACAHYNTCGAELLAQFYFGVGAAETNLVDRINSVIAVDLHRGFAGLLPAVLNGNGDSNRLLAFLVGKYGLRPFDLYSVSSGLQFGGSGFGRRTQGNVIRLSSGDTETCERRAPTANSDFVVMFTISLRLYRRAHRRTRYVFRPGRCFRQRAPEDGCTRRLLSPGYRSSPDT